VRSYRAYIRIIVLSYLPALSIRGLTLYDSSWTQIRDSINRSTQLGLPVSRRANAKCGGAMRGGGGGDGGCGRRGRDGRAEGRGGEVRVRSRREFFPRRDRIALPPSLPSPPPLPPGNSRLSEVCVACDVYRATIKRGLSHGCKTN